MLNPVLPRYGTWGLAGAAPRRYPRRHMMLKAGLSRFELDLLAALRSLRRRARKNDTSPISVRALRRGLKLRRAFIHSVFDRRSERRLKLKEWCLDVVEA